MNPNENSNGTAARGTGASGATNVAMNDCYFGNKCRNIVCRFRHPGQAPGAPPPAAIRAARAFGADPNMYPPAGWVSPLARIPEGYAVFPGAIAGAFILIPIEIARNLGFDPLQPQAAKGGFGGRGGYHGRGGGARGGHRRQAHGRQELALEQEPAPEQEPDPEQEPAPEQGRDDENAAPQPAGTVSSSESKSWTDME